MNWITIDTLKTIGGACIAVSVVTAGIKALLPSITGRRTQLIAFILSLVISVVIGNWSSVTNCFVSVLNAFVIFTASMGLDQTINYKENSPKNSSDDSLKPCEQVASGNK